MRLAGMTANAQVSGSSFRTNCGACSSCSLRRPRWVRSPTVICVEYLRGDSRTRSTSDLPTPLSKSVRACIIAGIDKSSFRRQGVNECLSGRTIPSHTYRDADYRGAINRFLASRELGQLESEDASKGILVTTSTFEPVAQRFARQHPYPLQLADNLWLLGRSGSTCGLMGQNRTSTGRPVKTTSFVTVLPATRTTNLR